MKRLISLILVVVTAFMAFSFDISAATYSVKIKKTYKNGYTYVTLTPSAGTVYYTTDGTKADKSDTKYTKKIKITEPTKLRMTIYKNGKAVKSLSTEIDVRIKAPTIVVNGAGKTQCTFKLKASPGSRIYYTLDGSKPDVKTSESVGSVGYVKVDAGKTLRAIAVNIGWKNSMVVKKTAPPSFEQIDPEEYEKEVIRLVNIERKKVGACELTTTKALSDAADVRAEEIQELFSHTRPDGRSCLSVFVDFGIIDKEKNCYGGTAENIASGQISPEEVVKAWMNSPGHKKAMLNPKYKKIGVGFKKNNWVQLLVVE